jgi:ribonucleoside-diphosphate reductase beta chain
MSYELYTNDLTTWRNLQKKKEKVDNPEPLLYDIRNSLFPLKYKPIWDMYKKHSASIWFNEEIDFTKDKKDWLSLNQNERYYIKKGIAFFASSDFIVNESGDVDATEAGPFEYKFFIDDKKARENIHSETYALLLEEYSDNQKEKEKLQNSVNNDNTITEKAKWFRRYVAEGSFVERIVAEAIMERIFFSGTFASIFWLKKRNIMPTLCDTNEFISRDEALHADFNVMLYRNYILNKLDPKIVKEMVKTGCEIEKKFVTSSLPVNLIGMNAELMQEYIEYLSDLLCMELLKTGVETSAELKSYKIYGSNNPFEWMSSISMQVHTDFFAHRPTTYGKSSVATGKSNKIDTSVIDF